MQQQESNFQNLQIFEREKMNKYCDHLSDAVESIVGKKPHLVGSVAKMLSGELPQNYEPKDVDFALDNISFRQVAQESATLFPFAKMVEKRPERIIIYTDEKCIELWNFFHKNYTETLQIHKNKIPYLCQLD